MRAKLLVNNPKGVDFTYMNFDPFASADDAHGRTYCQLFPFSYAHPQTSQQMSDPGLGRFIEAGEALEIFAPGIIPTIPRDKLPGVFAHWKSRLSFGPEVSQKGILRLAFDDAEKLLSFQTYLHTKDIWDTLSSRIYQRDFVSLYSCNEVISMLKACGMEIQSVLYAGAEVNVTATRSN